MSKDKILLVDDEVDILEMLKYPLEREGYDISTALDGERALAMCSEIVPDLIILDIMLPGIDGHQVCYRLKTDERYKHIPIILLTAKSDETDQVVGLKIGADDYVTKPFSPRVLVARVGAILRRVRQRLEDADGGDEILIYGDLIVDLRRHRVSIGERKLTITSVEFQILCLLIRRSGRVYNRNQIIEAVRGGDVYISKRTVDVHIAALRKKMGALSSLIETVHGVGYRFRERP